MPTDLLAFGWRIRSAIGIPGAVPISRGRIDVEIIRGRAIELPVLANPYALTASGFAFTVPGLARYVCEGGARIVVEPAPGADEARLRAMLVATVLPALAWVRGDVMLHAAAAVLPGASRAVAIAGASAVGKSTLLARMVAGGACAVADDSVRVSSDLRIAGLPGGRYRSGADGERRFVPFPPAAQCSQGRLGAIVILSARCASPERLTGVAAVAAVLAQRHRPTIARLMRREGDLLSTIVALAAAVPIVRWPAPGSPCYRAQGMFDEGWSGR